MPPETQSSTANLHIIEYDRIGIEVGLCDHLITTHISFVLTTYHTVRVLFVLSATVRFALSFLGTIFPKRRIDYYILPI